jgi:hypothetical protein
MIIVELQNLLLYCKNLKFEDEPNYIFIKGIFKNVMEQCKIEMDYRYDWNAYTPTSDKKTMIPCTDHSKQVLTPCRKGHSGNDEEEM